MNACMRISGSDFDLKQKYLGYFTEVEEDKGVTMAVFKAVGMIPELRDLLMMLRRVFLITVYRSCMRLPGIWSRTHVAGLELMTIWECLDWLNQNEKKKKGWLVKRSNLSHNVASSINNSLQNLNQSIAGMATVSRNVLTCQRRIVEKQMQRKDTVYNACSSENSCGSSSGDKSGDFFPQNLFECY